MTHARTRLAVSFARFAWVTGIVALLAGAAGVQANMQPPTMLLIHVQPWDPNFCNLPGIYGCENLVQTTGETGDLMAVVYLVSGCSGCPITSLDFTMQWGGYWGGDYGGVANCTDAQFSYEDDYYSVTVHFDWPNHPYAPTFMPLCAFGTYAGAHDCIQVLDDGALHWGYPEGWWETPLGGWAEAGVDCEFSCLRDCNPWSDRCVPQLTPEELHFELLQGQVGQATMHSVITGGYAGEVRFDATAWWVSLVATQTSNHTHDIVVTVETAGLAAGDYQARVRDTCDARDCSQIYLTVTAPDPQDVPDDGSPPPGEPTRTSWGGLKDLYRARTSR